MIDCGDGYSLNQAIMEKKLVGSVIREGVGLARKRLEDCKIVLAKYGISFPPFFPGTLNIRLEGEFLTPDWPNIIYIPQQEIDKVAAGFGEWWKLIPVTKINGKNIQGFIYRTRQNYHGNGVIELITKDLSRDKNFNLSPDEKIELIVSDNTIL